MYVRSMYVACLQAEPPDYTHRRDAVVRYLISTKYLRSYGVTTYSTSLALPGCYAVTLQAIHCVIFSECVVENFNQIGLGEPKLGQNAKVRNDELHRLQPSNVTFLHQDLQDLRHQLFFPQFFVIPSSVLRSK